MQEYLLRSPPPRVNWVEQDLEEYLSVLYCIQCVCREVGKCAHPPLSFYFTRWVRVRFVFMGGECSGTKDTSGGLYKTPPFRPLPPAAKRERQRTGACEDATLYKRILRAYQPTMSALCFFCFGVLLFLGNFFGTVISGRFSCPASPRPRNVTALCHAKGV